MSTETVKKFWQKAQTDKALQAKLAAIHEKERQATFAAVLKLAAEAGFVFTAQEYDAAIKEELSRQHAAGELTEAQLATLAGGVMQPHTKPDGTCSTPCGMKAVR